ncbi:sorting nexin-14 isoform X3, partial [Clarias magur]
MATEHINGNGTEEPMETSAAVTHSEHFQTLLDAGLPRKVAVKLDEIYIAGLVSHSDLDDRAIEALKEFNEEGALQVLLQFKDSDLSHVQNKSAFLCGVMKTYRQREKQGTKVSDSNKGPDETKIKALLERTGYTLDVTTGQRKYGGPPPESTHSGAQPTVGTEIFVGKIPRDLFEDELVPLFEKAGPIWDLRLMMDPLSGLNRGYAFVTFCTKEAAQEAVKLCNNSEIRPGKHIGVCISVANNRLFVGSIPKSKTKEQIVEEFAKVTEGLNDVILYHQPDDKKKNRGFCFLEYEDHKTAAQARRRLMSGKVKVWGNVVTVEWADPIEDPDPEVMAKVKVLFVRNLASTVSEELLEKTFSQFGKLERVKKLKDYAFIHFEDRDGAVKVEAEGVGEPVDPLCPGVEVQLQLEEEEVSPSMEAQDPPEGHVAPEEELNKEVAWYLHVIVIFWSFLAGVVTFYCSLGPETLLPNILITIKPKKKSEQQELFPFAHSCAVCGKIKCTRHRPTLLLENYQPWLDLKVHSKVDASLSEILELVLENFVYPWYRDITDDEAFVDDLRVTLRFVAAVLVRRAQRVDIPSLITLKLLKVSMKHIEIIAKARQKVKHSEHLQQAALEEYGPDLHVALRSRRDELLYLRKLTEMLFPYILPPKATDCRSLTLLIKEILAGSVFLPSMDYLADPDTVNHLLHIFIDNSPPEAATEPASVLVPFLQKYADIRNKKSSVLKLELKEIREQQDLLFRFMNFLKQEGAVHVLQFCLTVEEFNDKILRPELSDTEKLMLHEEVKKIYETYCLDDSVDKIRFDPFIVEEIRNIAEGAFADVIKLQTMRCLFEAYEHVLSLLENVFTPMFCHSDEYFRQLLRGAESPTRSSRLGRNSVSLDDIRNTSKRGESFGISRIGSKIKGVFKSTTMEGAMLPSYGLAEGEDDMVEEAIMVMEDDLPMEAISTPSTPRNLTAWSITIPYVDLFDDEVKKERIPVYCIDVERNDRRAVGHETEHWSVYRRYLEFYVLESKLTEFHGSFPDAQLPSKRIIGPKNYEFLTSKREEFQEYLQNLLQHPELSNSQLLADFLSPNSVESQFHDKMLPDVNLGKIIKSVPSKLIKEKGQHLEPFIQAFFNSCESPKPKPSRPELTILSPTSENNKKLFNELYKNNANRSEVTEKRHNQNYFMEMITVEGIYDYLMFLGRVVFHIPDWLHHLLMGGRILFKNTLEAYTDYYLQNKLDQVFQEHRVVSLITLLRDAVFCENSEPRPLEDKQKRARKTFDEMKNYIPDLLAKCIGEEAKYEGIKLLFDGLQQPVLNKQLTYILLDLVILELFPELNK